MIKVHIVDFDFKSFSDISYLIHAYGINVEISVEMTLSVERRYD